MILEAGPGSPATLPGEPISHSRRLCAYVLDVSLFWLTLMVGWFIWLAIVASRGQTPAKQLLGIYVYDYKTREIASAGRVWFREVVAKYVFPFLFATLAVTLVARIPGGQIGSLLQFLFPLALLVEGLSPSMIFFTPDRRAPWDYHSGTVLRWHQRRVERGGGRPPARGQSLKELDDLWGQGKITSEEYSRRRRAIQDDRAPPDIPT